MTTITSVLGQFPEALPKWLETYRQGDPFNRKEFFSSRIVYYPGAGSDGHAVELFNRAHAAHVFIHADYGLNRAEIEAQLDPGVPRHFRGYHVVGTIDVTQRQLSPNGWRPRVKRGEFAGAENWWRVEPYGFVAVFERDASYDEKHGAVRFAILFLGEDGIASYDALFCPGTDCTTPHAVLLQDHGFGGNYDWFGRGGRLHWIAKKAGVFPEWLVAGEGTEAWDGYSLVPGVRGDCGGMYHTLRYLYQRERTPGPGAR